MPFPLKRLAALLALVACSGDAAGPDVLDVTGHWTATTEIGTLTLDLAQDDLPLRNVTGDGTLVAGDGSVQKLHVRYGLNPIAEPGDTVRTYLSMHLLPSPVPATGPFPQYYLTCGVPSARRCVGSIFFTTDPADAVYGVTLRR